MSIQVHLTAAQMKNAHAGKTFQLKPEAFSKETNITLNLDKVMYNRASKSAGEGKGIRIKEGTYSLDDNEMKGGNAITKFFRSDNGQTIGKFLLDKASDAARKTGIISKNDANSAKYRGRKLLSENLKAGLKEEDKDQPSGGSVAMKRQAKGSPEMKEYMAMLRSRRGATSTVQNTGPIAQGEGIKDFFRKEGRIWKKGIKNGLSDSKKILFQPNVAFGVAASLATGNPAPAAIAVGTNAANLYLKKSGSKHRVNEQVINDARQDPAADPVQGYQGEGLRVVMDTKGGGLMIRNYHQRALVPVYTPQTIKPLKGNGIYPYKGQGIFPVSGSGFMKQ